MIYVKTNFDNPTLIVNAQTLERNIDARFSKDSINLMTGWSELLAVRRSPPPVGSCHTSRSLRPTHGHTPHDRAHAAHQLTQPRALERREARTTCTRGYRRQSPRRW